MLQFVFVLMVTYDFSGNYVYLLNPIYFKAGNRAS